MGRGGGPGAGWPLSLRKEEMASRARRARRPKWWGWGEEGHTFSLPNPERFWAFLGEQLGGTGESRRLASPDEIALPASRLERGALTALRRIVGKDGLSTETADRAVHSLGKGYRDVVRIRRGEIPSPTDAVLYPESEEQVAAILDRAARWGVAVIPFGGGTSVVGGVEPAGSTPTVTIDLRRLDRVLRLDPESATATLEPGILGPALEAKLNAKGFTLGHFPQSFEFSSLGGWIATRSAGQKSTLYGKIEETVERVRMVYPGGSIATPAVPAAAAGPDLTQLIAGSEGALGIITQATVRLAKAPALTDLRGYLFPSFEAGIAAAREIIQAELRPAVLRLSDEWETEANIVMQGASAGIQAAVLIGGFEGEEEHVRYGWARAEPILARHDGRSLGPGPGDAWQRARFELPYLRDVLLDHAIMVDTLETAMTWDRYLGVHKEIRAAMLEALEGRGWVMAHLSHSYSDGGSIYYTFLARQKEGRELEQWERLKAAATQVIVDAGCALSHHHGIGSDHRPWMAAYLGPGGIRALVALKDAFDPQGIMNPGKLTVDVRESRHV